MKISGIGAGGAVAGAPRRTDKTAKGDGFRRTLAESLEAGEEPVAVEAPVGLTAVDALLMVQQDGGATGREARRRLVRRGQDLIEGLEDLRHGLLLGEIPAARVAALAQTLRTRRESCDDPRLGTILDEIELRVAVELAKLSPRA
ncbi:flagellar assembly protein FliX [Phaeospirillum tilakii]|uniref:Flagellar assembly protein FliX n=1 Tax=Phaeospirillum tilakii TaxID=741673 RepID=A0ABW5C9M6_9PROT